MKDPYVNSNGVLKNKLNITDYDELNKAEADIGFLKLISIDSIPFDSFDGELVRSIHRYIFENIFDWAGEYGMVPLIKEEVVLPGYSIPYTEYKNIPKELNEKIDDLNKVAWQNLSTSEIAFMFARKMALIWKVHPFRDGNTRTILSYAYLYAKEHGFPFDMKTFTENLSRSYFENGNIKRTSVRDKFVVACLDEEFSPEVKPLAAIFEKSIKREEEKKSNHHK